MNSDKIYKVEIIITYKKANVNFIIFQPPHGMVICNPTLTSTTRGNINKIRSAIFYINWYYSHVGFVLSVCRETHPTMN